MRGWWEEGEGVWGCCGELVAVSDWVAVLPEAAVRYPASGSGGWLTGTRREESYIERYTTQCVMKKRAI